MVKQVKIKIDSLDQAALYTELSIQFPHGKKATKDGCILGFELNLPCEDSKIIDVINYLDNKGYKPMRNPKDYSCEYLLHHNYTFNQIDYGHAKYLYFSTKNGMPYQYETSCIKDGMALVSRMPGKMKYFYLFRSIKLLSEKARTIIENQKFIGFEFFPVFLAKVLEEKFVGGWDHYEILKPIEGVFAMRSTVVLPRGKINDDMLRYYDRTEIENLGEFDLATKYVTERNSPDVGSQRFYEFCKREMDDLTWEEPLVIL